MDAARRAAEVRISVVRIERKGFGAIKSHLQCSRPKIKNAVVLS